ncbi:superoxide dismutase family protein [Brevibacillus sp. TJ4]|uniref:superoxide dismutase family protein n=1 Tax=Brevibacillus sp. TJ4 TaxID=3234853 RepID=UPI003B9E144B
MYGFLPNAYMPLSFPHPVSSQYGRGPSEAVAEIHGGPLAPHIRGYVVFTDVPYGCDVFIEVSGLPPYQPARDGQQPIGPISFHLHENGSCAVGDPNNPFLAAGEHWNPTRQPHGNHAGDFPVLFSNDGYARMTFFTNKLSAAEAVGKTVILHQNPDDFRSQPSGNAGKRLACGLVQASYM